ncbi:hypothetical protein ACJ41O_005795 [Fusarium nematophilum]
MIFFFLLAAIVAAVAWHTFFRSPASHTVSSQNSEITSRALPAEWYKSRDIYELERRAIFSKKWILLTHKHRFPETGTWVRYEEAGFQFYLIRNKEGRINAFHNVCRHRAFPIVTEERGHSKSGVLACKYHGWSYGLNGQLAKAPEYGDLDGFDKTKNGLFPVHVHVDAKGFVWVNMDARKKPEVAWADDFAGVDQLARHETFNFDDYKFDNSWKASSSYNWKALADTFNGYHHYQTTHPGASSLVGFQDYKLDAEAGNEKGLTIVSNFYFPNACMAVSNDTFYMMRCVPMSPSECTMEYEVYRHKDTAEQDFKSMDEKFKRILGEDQWLGNLAQGKPDSDIVVEGHKKGRLEQGPLYFQNQVRQLVNQHRELEKEAGREVRPAQQIMPNGATDTEEDLLLCSGLACGKGAKELEW